MERQLVIFELNSEHYGVSIAAVESIIKMQPITRLPQAPDYIEGVTSLRGSILPVIDLRRRFGLAAGEATALTRIVVVNMNGVKVGMIVDSVSEVLRIADEDIEPIPEMVTTVSAAYLQGIVKIADRLVILLDLNQTLNSMEQQELQVLAAGA